MEDDFYVDYGKLDSVQRQFIDRKVTKSMVITGKAGSGKSVIALHKAKQVSTLGSYTVVVFTKTLKKYFSDGLSKLGLKSVYHYHDWKDSPSRVKYLIVDECQDFSSDEINELKNHGEICFFFGDSDQSIMKFRGPTQTVQDTANALGVMMEPLYTNYRLTIENARLSEVVGTVDDVAEKCIRNGEKPKIIKKDTIDQQLDEILRIIKNGALSNVGILMPFNSLRSAQSRMGNEKLSVEYVKNYFLRKGNPIEFKYNANRETEMELDFHSSNPKIMTWWCAKGLQFKDVFIPACEINYEEEKRSALYVAMTRSSERLYLLFSGRPSMFFPNPESDLYAKQVVVDLS
jgi:superfamily I DNA/RNA helicase